MNNDGYVSTYVVSDCLKKGTVLSKFKADTIKSNYILQGQKVWRSINLENKQNQQSFNSSVKCSELNLFEIMKYGIFVKKLNAFSSDDFNETKTHRLTNQQILKSISLNDTSAVDVFDANGDKTTQTIIDQHVLYGSDIKSFLLKEDWIINNYSGKIEKRIIGIAPVVFDSKQQKNVPLFWLYYAEWKQLFSSFEIQCSYSDLPVSFNEVLVNHYYISVLSKKSNMFDRSIKSVNHGKDSYSEGELIDENMNSNQEDLFPK